MAQFMNGIKRTNYCGEVTKENVGQNVVLTGWVAKVRNLGGLMFIWLRDRTGRIQLFFNEETDKELFELAASVKNEYVLAVEGLVCARNEADINKDMKTGEIEVKVTKVVVLNEAKLPPFHIEDKANISDVNRLKYRYLDLRRPSMQNVILMRHKIAKIARDYYDENGFIEVETPILTKSTPEGARDYLVPSRVHPSKFYALPQSPQIFKQLLMVAGFDRYMQIAKCFRDEDLRADRQPEFTQIDLEMSFVDIDDVIAINEGFMVRVFKEVLGVELKAPFMRMSYFDAMEKYGSDKPDVRFGYELIDLADTLAGCGFKVFSDSIASGGAVKAVCFPAGHYSRKEIDKLGEFVKTHGGSGLAWIVVGENNEIRSSLGKVLTPDEINAVIAKCQAKAGDLICIVSGKTSVVYTVLGALRCELADKLGLIPQDEFAFLWITEFPQFEFSEEENRYVAVHHPFTSPMEQDIDKIESAPGEVRAKAYDIVLNGYELGGGSIRIHDSELQSRMFKALGLSDEDVAERFGFLIEAFKYGTPPHGGMAYGLDRLCMLMAGATNIRDTIAFPKVQNASCLMSGAPDFVDDIQVKDLHISINKEDVTDSE